MTYRLGLDVGTNSIGWAILKLNVDGEPFQIEKMGVRIFSDGRNPKDKTSLAINRRLKRQARRRRDRFLERKTLVLNELTRLNLFPANQEEREKLKALDVLALRAKAVKVPLARYELGRVIYQMNMKRGFKSGRKESAEDKANKISERIKHLEDSIAAEGALSYGDYLQKRREKGFRTQATVETGFYPVRHLIEKEFDQIVNIQKTVLPDISPERWSKLRGLIFHQRPLRPIEKGPCGLYRGETRASRYLPSFEQYRLLSELYNIRYRDDRFVEHGLSQEQIISAFEKCKLKGEIKFPALRKLVGLSAETDFTIEERQKLKACPTAAFFSKKDVLGEQWSNLSLEKQDQIAEIFVETEERDETRNKLLAVPLAQDIVDHLVAQPIKDFPDATGAFSGKALREIIGRSLEEQRPPGDILRELLKEESLSSSLATRLEYYGKAIPESVQPVPKAIQENGSHLDPEERRYGKIANPTVHIGLNQIRKVVNELIERYGSPAQVHIEFARDLKLSQKQKDELDRSRRRNQALNEKVAEFIKDYGMKPTAFNREKVKLWFEIENTNERKCVYSGKPILQGKVLSEEVEIDHILPFSRTLDDRLCNKVLVFASENRLKGNRTPYEAFGKDTAKMDAILDRAALLPPQKRRQFAENAMERFEQENFWLARQLTDTSYLAKVAKKYLSTVVEDKNIVCLPGRLTSLVRGKLGLNRLLGDNGEKNRNDHRHHAVDALTIALIDRSSLQKMARASENERSRIEIEEPWATFHRDAKSTVDQVFASHRVDHGVEGGFVEETCFGLVKQPTAYERANDFKLVVRKPLVALAAKDSEKIRGPKLREKGIEALHGGAIRRVRLLETSRENAEGFGKPDSAYAKVMHGVKKQHMKLYAKGDIHHAGFWRLPNGKVEVSCVKFFDLNALKLKRRTDQLRPHPAAKLIMRIHKRDTVAMEIDGQTKLFQIKSIRAANKQILFLEVNAAEQPKDTPQFLLAFSKLKEKNFRKVYVSPSGNIIDRGCRL